MVGAGSLVGIQSGAGGSGGVGGIEGSWGMCGAKRGASEVAAGPVQWRPGEPITVEEN